MLEIEQLNHYYSESHTLWDFDLALEAGRCNCLMGATASVKRRC